MGRQQRCLAHGKLGVLKNTCTSQRVKGDGVASGCLVSGVLPVCLPRVSFWHQLIGAWLAGRLAGWAGSSSLRH
jgi:hypothetical protein